MAKYGDLFPHLGAEWSSGYFMQAFLKHASPDILPHAAKLHGHLHGGRRLQRAEYNRLEALAATEQDENGRPVFSPRFLGRLRKAYELADEKHALAELHSAGLRMPRLGTRSRKEIDPVTGKPVFVPEVGARVEPARLGPQSRLSRADHDRELQTLRGTKAMREWNDRLEELAHQSRAIARAGVLYGGVALNSASPDAMATLQGSFALLAAQMGRTLIPAAVEASGLLQGLANRFEKLNPEMKKFVGGTAALGIAGAALVAAAPSLVASYKLLTGTLGVARSAFSRGVSAAGATASFAGAHPYLTSAAIGLAVASSLAAYHQYQRSGLQLEHEQKSVQMQERLENLNVAELQRHPLYKEVSGAKLSHNQKLSRLPQELPRRVM